MGRPGAPEHALRSRNLLMVRANGWVASGWWTRLAIEEPEPERFEMAAVRWAGRLALETTGLALVARLVVRWSAVGG